MRSSRKHGRGFTLIEVLLVVLIIGLLAGVLVFYAGQTPEKAKKDLTKTLVDQVCGALDRYKLDIGHYPTDEEGGLKALRIKPQFSDEKLGEKWAGPYVKADPLDPWDKALSYQVSDPSSEEAKTLPYKVWSWGPNGQDDNGTNDDIRNRTWEDSEATR